MTGPKENSEFCFPEALNTLRSRGTKLNVSGGTSYLVFCYTSQLKKKKINYEEIVCFTPADSQICRSLKEHDLIMCE